jgi:hypothetical protein
VPHCGLGWTCACCTRRSTYEFTAEYGHVCTLLRVQRPADSAEPGAVSRRDGLYNSFDMRARKGPPWFWQSVQRCTCILSSSSHTMCRGIENSINRCSWVACTSYVLVQTLSRASYRGAWHADAAGMHTTQPTVCSIRKASWRELIHQKNIDV